MKAHAEIGLTCAGGKKGCRRCEVVGDYVPSKRHYYYGHFLQRYHNPVDDRTVEKSLANAIEVENTLTMSHKAELSKKYGVTGVSVFYRWYSLCGFDPVNDLVIDHCLELDKKRTGAFTWAWSRATNYQLDTLHHYLTSCSPVLYRPPIILRLVVTVGSSVVHYYEKE